MSEQVQGWPYFRVINISSLNRPSEFIIHYVRSYVRVSVLKKQSLRVHNLSIKIMFLLVTYLLLSLFIEKKSRKQETLNLSAFLDSSTNLKAVENRENGWTRMKKVGNSETWLNMEKKNIRKC